MDTTEIQSRLDRACGVANKKGLITPAVTFQVVSHKHLDCYLTNKEPESKWDSYEFFRGDTPEEILSKLDAHVAGLPTLKEAKFNQFMAALGRILEPARGHHEAAFRKRHHPQGRGLSHETLPAPHLPRLFLDCRRPVRTRPRLNLPTS